MKCRALVTARAFDVVILPDDVMLFLLSLPLFLANVACPTRTNPAQTSKRIGEKANLRSESLGKSRLTDHF